MRSSDLLFISFNRPPPLNFNSDPLGRICSMKDPFDIILYRYSNCTLKRRPLKCITKDTYPWTGTRSLSLTLYVVFDKSHTVCYQFIIHGSDE